MLLGVADRDENVKKQIMAIRDMGITNMFDIRVVMEIAEQLGFDELLEFLPENKARYVSFIIEGR